MIFLFCKLLRDFLLVVKSRYVLMGSLLNTKSGIYLMELCLGLVVVVLRAVLFIFCCIYFFFS